MQLKEFLKSCVYIVAFFVAFVFAFFSGKGGYKFVKHPLGVGSVPLAYADVPEVNGEGSGPGASEGGGDGCGDSSTDGAGK
jgi:hypothetical protein